MTNTKTVSVPVEVEKLKALATKAAQPVGNMAAHDVVVRQFTTLMEFRNAFSPDLILKLIASHEALTALAPKEQQAQAGEADWCDQCGRQHSKDLPLYCDDCHAALQPHPQSGSLIDEGSKAQAVDEREAFEKWARKESDRLGLELAKDMTCCDGRFPATYREQETETAWRAWANKPRAALSAQPTVAAEQEPVAWMVKFEARLGGARVTDRLIIWRKDDAKKHVREELIEDIIPLYTHSPKGQEC